MLYSRRWQLTTPLPAEKLTTNAITRAYRFSHVITHTLLGVMIIAVVFPFCKPNTKLCIIQWWHRRLLVGFNIKVVIHGLVPQNNQTTVGTFIVANHISWLDVHALNSLVSLRFIAKSDIKDWPVVGYLAKNADVLFIERDKRKDAMRIAHITASSLNAGDNLCLFPEGTTTDGTTMKPFKSGIMQAAIHANANIQAVAIRYPHQNGGVSTAMAYADDTTMAQSISMILQQKNPKIELHFLAPINISHLADEEKDRRQLTQQIEQSIRDKLGL